MLRIIKASMKMTTVTTTLVKKLTEGSVSFKFRKVDGSIREATGTLNNDLIPEGLRSTAIPADDAATVAYYDLGSNGWRSFRADAVVA
jgi:hypothetical protein